MKKLQGIPARLPLGKFVIGPDHYGCMNTGLAPGLLKSRKFKAYGNLVDNYKFAVGPQLFIEDAISAKCFGKSTGKTFHKVDNHYIVKFFKTAKPAKAYFEKLCQVIIESNQESRKDHQANIDKAKKGDMQAALNLMDY